jgi:hypothetical protein
MISYTKSDRKWGLVTCCGKAYLNNQPASCGIARDDRSFVKLNGSLGNRQPNTESAG